MGLITFILIAIIIYICYIIWDFFYYERWLEWIPGYSWVNSWFGPTEKRFRRELD